MHRKLVKKGAPELPANYYYYPVVDFVGQARYLCMTIRRRSGIWSEEVSRWTVDPLTYFNGDDITNQVIALCENAVRQCDDFEVEEV